MPASNKSNPLVSIIDRKLDVSKFREQHWEGTFWDYLDLAIDNPSVARNAFQRVYDMILTYGTEAFSQFKQELTRYKFFSDPIDNGGGALFRLGKAPPRLVGFFKSPGQGDGTRRGDLLPARPAGASQTT